MTEAVSEPALVGASAGQERTGRRAWHRPDLDRDSQLDDSATAVLSPRDMVTVVGNLVDNALDAADPDDPWVEVSVAGDRSGVTIVVADSGPGMDRETFVAARQRDSPPSPAATPGAGASVWRWWCRWLPHTTVNCVPRTPTDRWSAS